MTHGETIPIVVFDDFTRHIGIPAMRAVLEHTTPSDGVENPNQGLTIEDEEARGWAINANDTAITFRYKGWGPYTLGIEVAREIINQLEGIVEEAQ